MGCGGSSEKKQSPVAASTNYDRRPKISVRLGTQVKKLDSNPRVIFIFGGPGSRKGCVVDDLVRCYSLKFICGEDVIFQDLPRKVANAMKIETVKEVKELLEADPSHVTLEWLMHMIERRIERDGDTNAIYLVDLVPNMKYLMRIPSLLEDCSEALEKFEERFPISFALNLAVPADKVLKAKQVYCATPAGTGEKMKETGGQGDEADTGRTQRRAALFEQSSQPFIDYFIDSDKLVTVDVTCGVASLIWHRVHQLMCELDFHPKRTINTVMLFAFEESEVTDIDYDKYLMERLYLQNLVDNPDDTTENLLKCLGQHINNRSRDCDSFVIILEGTCITKESVEKTTKKPVIFMHIAEGHIEKYLPGSPINFVPKADSTKYKAVSSLENEICLFPKDTPDDICSRIAAQMLLHRQL